LKTITVECDSQGILLASLDVPERSMNTITHEVIADLESLVKRVKDDPAIKGLVLTSGKANGFCSGADLDELDAANTGESPTSPQTLEMQLRQVAIFKDRLRALETCGKPVASAINGLALGGGLEILLATHYRVAADIPSIQLGLPEATIGLMPGGGGTQRLPRIVGIEKALPILLEGKPISVTEAHTCGIVDRLVKAGEEVETAKAWIRNTAISSQPWDRAGFKIPGGGPYDVPAVMVMATSRLRQRSFDNNPAALNTLRSVYEGTMVPIDAGLRIEARYFLLTRNSPQAKAMVRSLFLSMQELKRGVSRPKDAPKFAPKRLVVIGAGIMGAGVASVSAQAGIDVELIDRTEADAARAQASVVRQLQQKVDKGRLAPEAMSAALARIHVSTDFALASAADIAIEAVFEDRAVKAAVTSAVEQYLPATALFASNTSGLPITELARHSGRPENFIGIHFFSPVDRMALVEIIRGERTSDVTLARAIDFARLLRKTPIVVRDSRGFYTSRTFQTYLEEGFEMLAEGVAPAVIENVARTTGMPRGPLEIADDTGLDLYLAARRQLRRDLGDHVIATAQDLLLPRIVEQEGRHGRKNRRGCYDYPEHGPKRLWSGLTVGITRTMERPSAVERETLKRRLLYRQSLEAARVLAEGVIDDPRQADVGALLGWGFPAWTGGPISLIDQISTAEFVRRCDTLAAQYGARFKVPSQLREMAARGEAYYQRATLPVERAGQGGVRSVG
jgi:3-hydroxyacyl-CoA dehydrogenase/enoyl-CoA hydratase/3-hydroxybutyryl-CoA epimerase